MVNRYLLGKIGLLPLLRTFRISRRILDLPLRSTRVLLYDLLLLLLQRRLVVHQVGHRNVGRGTLIFESLDLGLEIGLLFLQRSLLLLLEKLLEVLLLLVAKFFNDVELRENDIFR